MDKKTNNIDSTDNIDSEWGLFVDLDNDNEREKEKEMHKPKYGLIEVTDENESIYEKENNEPTYLKKPNKKRSLLFICFWCAGFVLLEYSVIYIINNA